MVAARRRGVGESDVNSTLTTRDDRDAWCRRYRRRMGPEARSEERHTRVLRRRRGRAAAPGCEGKRWSRRWPTAGPIPTKLYLEGRRAAQLLDAARAAMAEDIGGTGRRGHVLRQRVPGGRARRSPARGLVAPGSASRGALARSSTPRCCGRPRRALGVAYPWTAWVVSIWTAFAAPWPSPAWPWRRCIARNHEVGTVQPVAEPPRPATMPACRCSWTRPSPSAGCRCPRLVVADGERRTSGAGRPASACWWCARACGGRSRGRSSGSTPTRSACRWSSPPPRRCARSRPTMAGRAAGCRALVDRIRARVAADVPDVEVVGDPVDAAAAPGHVLVPVRRR